MNSLNTKNNMLFKIYSLLSLQLFTTFSIVFSCVSCKSILDFILSHTKLMIVNVIMLFATTISICFFCRKYPVNIFLLCSFTVEMSYLLVVICSVYRQNSDIIIISLGTTTLSFISLSYYIYKSKRDICFIEKYLYFCLNILILWGISLILLGYKSSYLYCVFGVFTFSSYILVDTSIIINKLEEEDYVLGVLLLYLDFINLFIKIVELSRDEKNNK